MIRSIHLAGLVRLGVGALVLLIAHGIAAPGSARAGCNHLVTSQSERRLELHRLDDLITGGGAELGSGQDRPAHGPRQCSGPGCSNGVPWPAPTAAPVTHVHDHWIAIASALSLTVVSSPRLVADEPAACPAGHRPSIFHPPPV